MIRVSDLGKRYRIFDGPRARFKQMVKSSLGFPRDVDGAPSKYYKEFWALRGVNFELRRGEVLGILGQNGSGKSTLLQMLVGTLTPTKGTVETNGKVAALLELGAGFNPEFTGRENVSINCAIAGLSEQEIESRFKSIVDFADIGDFIDRPVRTYSSGMYVRLAFSAALGVDPDILIIDEALAVGDARFQNKCFNRLEELKKRGVTILFVTHDVAAIKSFCTRAMVLDHGQPTFAGGPMESVVKYYEAMFPGADGSGAQARPGGGVSDETASQRREVSINPEEMPQLRTFGLGGGLIEKMEISGLKAGNVFSGGDDVELKIYAKWSSKHALQLASEKKIIPNILIGFALSDLRGMYLFGCHLFDKAVMLDATSLESAAAVFKFKLPHLASGSYFVTAAISLGTQENHVQLKWYDAVLELSCVSPQKYSYGLLHLPDYSATVV
ncbi:MAG: ABC transporter ATP-binding protein [Elusimicrobia bacterium]|nr:ABC transporter ATP-binding protein [Elusimicrobiota bacterium]